MSAKAKEFQKAEQDPSVLAKNADNSPEVQIEILTKRIKNLTQNFKSNSKDNHSRRGLLMMINRRRSLLRFLKNRDVKRYDALIERLGLRQYGSKSKASAAKAPSDKTSEPITQNDAAKRGLRIAQSDLELAGGALSEREVQALMGGISHTEISKLTANGELFCLSYANSDNLYPKILFDSDGTPVSGIRDILAALPTENRWSALNFLIHPNELLGDRSPLAVLQKGEVSLAVLAAKRFGEMGG